MNERAGERRDPDHPVKTHLGLFLTDERRIDVRRAAELVSFEGAEFSHDRRFRYLLWRRWTLDTFFTYDKQIVHFCMLNPSVADEHRMDATLRRCKGFAQRWGFEAMLITNVAPFVATYPGDLLMAEDRFGPDGGDYNRFTIRHAASLAALTIVAWGANVRDERLAPEVARVIETLRPYKPHALRVTQDGLPCHPLRLPYSLEPKEYVA